MKKLLTLLFLSIVLISLASATVPTIKQGQSIDLTGVCDNCTYMNLTKVENINGVILLGQYAMTKNGTNYNYTLNANQTRTLGTHKYTTCGDLNGILTCEDTDETNFLINGTGFEFTTGTSMFYIALLGLLIFLFVINLVAISKIPAGNPRADSGNILSISLLKYLKPTLIVVAWGLIVALLFISSSIASSYLGDQSFSKFLFGLFKLSTRFVYPMLLLWVIWILVHVFKDIKIKQFFDRGYSPI